MPNKTPSIIAGLSTFLILIVVGILSVFGQIVLLNGASESLAFNALSISVICQSAGLLFAVILARWLTKWLLTKFNWNTVLAIITAVIAATGFGALVSFSSIILSTLFTGIR